MIDALHCVQHILSCCSATWRMACIGKRKTITGRQVWVELRQSMSDTVDTDFGNYLIKSRVLQVFTAKTRRVRSLCFSSCLRGKKESDMQDIYSLPDIALRQQPRVFAVTENQRFFIIC